MVNLNRFKEDCFAFKLIDGKHFKCKALKTDHCVKCKFYKPKEAVNFNTIELQISSYEARQK